MFDILIIGGGHAGIEAAYISSQFNLKIGVISLPEVPIGSAPCNPSVGGIGKGQVVREIDALGGIMGYLADKAGIQFRTLNDSKGYAVQSTRVQIDKELYSFYAQEALDNISNITIIRERVDSLTSEQDYFVVTTEARSYRTRKLILTVGTFLNGKMHTGSDQSLGGRVGCSSSKSLAELMSSISPSGLRFKTGTPPRLRKNSINYSALEEQPSDPNVRNFHSLHEPFGRFQEQVSCYLAYTNNNTMDVIRASKEQSPMFNGQIKGVGARYCPSIEDKAYRYPDKNIHHVFIEPESLSSETMYPSGISSSLPKDIQLKYVQSIKGLESAEIEVFGYAVEYDVLDTTKLHLTLEHKEVSGVYFAGQVNGTSGYEEAAGQGYIAGVNAALSLLGRAPLILSRHDSYIGVMIEDLVSNLRDEPYRLFTARSENRLLIREDNTTLRMYPYRRSLGLDYSIDKFQADFLPRFNLLYDVCSELSLDMAELFNYDVLQSSDFNNRSGKISLDEVLRQAKVDPVSALMKILDIHGLKIDYDIVKLVAIEKKYDGYIKRSNEYNNKLKKMDGLKIDWTEISESTNISFECRQRISRIKPETFGQLRLIEGIRPATLAVVAAGAL
jgi:tRNA uridine 5-carboxymethylaminomethyl modification enzyme